MIMNSTDQLNLIGHESSFISLVTLYSQNKFPNKLLISGKNGIGKSTFAYHLINYIFSLNEENSYNLKNFNINTLNISYKLIQNSTHPNFFKIQLKKDKKYIDISQVREMKNFTNKSSFNKKSKIVLIDGVENLNINSVNALLKIIEEPNNNLLFILTHNSETKITETLSSRCIKFNLTLDYAKIEKIVDNYFSERIFNLIPIDLNHFSLTPKYYIDLILFCRENKLDLSKININSLLKFIIKNKIYKKEIISKYNLKLYIQLFFMKMSNANSSIESFDLYKYFLSKFNQVIHFNLDYEPFFIELNSKFLNEK